MVAIISHQVSYRLLPLRHGQPTIFFLLLGLVPHHTPPFPSSYPKCPIQCPQSCYCCCLFSLSRSVGESFSLSFFYPTRPAHPPSLIQQGPFLVPSHDARRRRCRPSGRPTERPTVVGETSHATHWEGGSVRNGSIQPCCHAAMPCQPRRYHAPAPNPNSHIIPPPEP